MKIKGYIPQERIPTKLDIWYDVHTKHWIIQLLDQNGYELNIDENRTALYVKGKVRAETEYKGLKEKFDIKE